LSWDPSSRRWISLALIVAIAAGLRLLTVWVLADMPPVSDAADYVALARSLAASGSAGAFYWPPGLPRLLAGVFGILGDSLAVIRGVVLLLSLAGVFLAMLLARTVSPDRRIAVAVGVLGACYVPAVLLSGQPYSQHLAAVCMLGTAVGGQKLMSDGRWRWSVLTGLSLGIGCLTRPSIVSVLPLALVFPAMVLARRARREGSARALLSAPTKLAVVGVIVAAALFPAMRHNARNGEGWTISTNNERNLFLGNNPYTPNYKTSYLASRPLETLDPEVRDYLTSVYARAPKGRRSVLLAEAMTYVAGHPRVTLYRTFNRALAFWGFDYLGSREIQQWYQLRTKTIVPLLCLEAGCYLIVMVLALVGIFGLWGEILPRPSLWLLGLVFSYAAPYALSFSEGLYHHPIIWLLLPFAGVTLVRLSSSAERLDLAQRLRKRPLAWVSIIALLAIQIQYAYWVATMPS
jgi:4-amino-4-deoxy-L-arabinose transferase-like glycosyltransferase